MEQIYQIQFLLESIMTVTTHEHISEKDFWKHTCNTQYNHTTLTGTVTVTAGVIFAGVLCLSELNEERFSRI